MNKDIQALKKYSNKSIFVTFVDDTFGICKNRLILDYFHSIPLDDPNSIKISNFFEESYANKEISRSLYEKYNNILMAKRLNSDKK